VNVESFPSERKGLSRERLALYPVIVSMMRAKGAYGRVFNARRTQARKCAPHYVTTRAADSAYGVSRFNGPQSAAMPSVINK